MKLLAIHFLVAVESGIALDFSKEFTFILSLYGEIL